MLYALAVIGRWFCPPKRNTDAGTSELNQTKQPDGTTTIPTPPPNTPVITPVGQSNYPDLPTLNPSIVRKEESESGTYVA